MTVIEALQNALELLETVGYRDGGDIHDNLAQAIARIAKKAPRVAKEELE